MTHYSLHTKLSKKAYQMVLNIRCICQINQYLYLAVSIKYVFITIIVVNRQLNNHQYQFCFAQDKRDDECTSLQGLSTTVPPGFPQTSEIQLALYNLLTQLSYRNDASTAFDYIQPFSTNPLFNPPLPKDQWVKTLIKIEMSVLTQLQIGLSTYAIGTSNLGLEIATPMRSNQTEGDKGLCSLQRMRSPGGFV